VERKYEIRRQREQSALSITLASTSWAARCREWNSRRETGLAGIAAL